MFLFVPGCTAFNHPTPTRAHHRVHVGKKEALTPNLKALLLVLPGLAILISQPSPLHLFLYPFRISHSIIHPATTPLSISSCVSLHPSFITHCLTVIYSIQSALSLHSSSLHAFTTPVYGSSRLSVIPDASASSRNPFYFSQPTCLCFAQFSTSYFL